MRGDNLSAERYQLGHYRVPEKMAVAYSQTKKAFKIQKIAVVVSFEETPPSQQGKFYLWEYSFFRGTA